MEDAPFMQVTVSDPMKHSEGMQAYATFKVTTKTNLERFDGAHFFVHRRYSDFVWLQEQLTVMYPGLVIPPLPEKQVVGRFSEPFLAQRQRALEKFLRRIAAHEQLRDNTFVKAFLEFESLESTKASVAKENKKGEKSFLDWVSAATNTITNKISGPPVVRPKSENDEKFQDVKQYVDALAPQMTTVHKHSYNLVEKGKEMAQALFDFGLAFTLLGQSEPDALGDAMSQLGQSADKLSRITAEEAEKESQFFEEPLKDYVRLVQRVKIALDARTEKEAAYEALLGELDSKVAVREKIRQSQSTDQASRLDAAEADVKMVTRQVEDAKADFELVTCRVLSEMETFKSEKLVDFKSIILDYVQLQIEYNQQVEKTWREVLPSLRALNVNEEQHIDDAKSSNSPRISKNMELQSQIDILETAVRTDVNQDSAIENADEDDDDDDEFV